MAISLRVAYVPGVFSIVHCFSYDVRGNVNQPEGPVGIKARTKSPPDIRVPEQ